MVMEPLRAPPVFSAAVIVTFRLPVPPAGDTLTQDRLSEMVQAQSESEAVTDTISVPPPQGKLSLTGVML